MIGDKLNYLDLAKHALLDSFEFSAHTEDEVFGLYTLNGVGVDFFVGFDEESVLKSLEANGCKKIIFAHTHPLINDNSLYFQKGLADQRKLIAYGQKILPLGNCPSQGDIKYFDELKLRASQFGIEIVGAVFSVRGVWIFSTMDDVRLNEEYVVPKRRPENFFDALELRGMYPSYFMEVQQPKIRTRVEYSSNVPSDIFRELFVKLATPFFKIFNGIKVRRIVKSFSKQGVNIEFIDYKSKGIDPVFLLKSGITQWENAQEAVVTGCREKHRVEKIEVKFSP